VHYLRAIVSPDFCHLLVDSHHEAGLLEQGIRALRGHLERGIQCPARLHDPAPVRMARHDVGWNRDPIHLPCHLPSQRAGAQHVCTLHASVASGIAPQSPHRRTSVRLHQPQASGGQPSPGADVISSGADVARVGPVPVQMWHEGAQSRRRCRNREASPGADVASVPLHLPERGRTSREGRAGGGCCGRRST
jgi:hypothetical protein